MSYDQCIYCGGMAFKTNGKAELICLDRAESGICGTRKELKSHGISTAGISSELMSIFTLEKTFYPKPKRLNFGTDDAKAILQMEVEAHIRKHPGIKFMQIMPPKKESHGGITYKILFQPEVYEAVSPADTSGQDKRDS